MLWWRRRLFADGFVMIVGLASYGSSDYFKWWPATFHIRFDDFFHQVIHVATAIKISRLLLKRSSLENHWNCTHSTEPKRCFALRLVTQMTQESDEPDLRRMDVEFRRFDVASSVGFHTHAWMTTVGEFQTRHWMDASLPRRRNSISCRKTLVSFQWNNWKSIYLTPNHLSKAGGGWEIQSCSGGVIDLRRPREMND